MATKTEKIRLAESEWTTTSFDPRVEGVESITHEGTEMAMGKAKEVRDAAERAGVALAEGDPPAADSEAREGA